jgi:type I restriction enzyme, S subunit
MNVSIINVSGIKESSNILKPNFHLNYGKKRITKLRYANRDFTTLGSLTKRVYTGGIFKRIFVNKIQNGIPYISGQHLLNADPVESSKLISKKYTPRQEDMTLRNGQILVSCAGTVGNVRLITQDLDGIIGSQDIIRVIADSNKSPLGFIYAYLASPTSFNYIQSYIYGSVVPRINPDTLSGLPIPIFPKHLELQVNDLIVKACSLRVSANELLKQTINELESNYTFFEKSKVYSVNIKEVRSGDKYTNESRLESDFYQPATANLIRSIEKTDYSLLGDLSHEVRISNIRARKFAKRGIPFITGQDIGLLKPDTTKTLSLKLTANIPENMTKDYDILVTAFGTLGKVEFVNENFYKNVFASQQIARVRINPQLAHPGYVYLILKSRIGYDQMIKYKTGSVIEWFNWNNLSSLRIPIPKDRGEKLGEIALKVTDQFRLSFDLEQEAIKIIENTIESWQN